MLSIETEPVAHSTVQTLLRQLEAKGAVGHAAENRTFVFFPRLKEDKVKRTAARELVRPRLRRRRGEPGRSPAQERTDCPGTSWQSSAG